VLDHFLAADFTSGVLCGDSAGGALALAVERQASRWRPKICGAASFYGCFGLAANPALYRKPGLSDGLDAASVRRYWVAANACSGQSPYSIPALAHPDGPPVYLLAAGRDPLRDDTIALARALREKGRSVTMDLQPFADHSFLQAPHARRAKQAAFRSIAGWIGALSS
jgi:acetyl esterase